MAGDQPAKPRSSRHKEIGTLSLVCRWKASLLRGSNRYRFAGLLLACKEKYDYKPDFGLHVYGDDWEWTDDNKYRWREHEGRGYWGRVWIEF